MITEFYIKTGNKALKFGFPNKFKEPVKNNFYNEQTVNNHIFLKNLHTLSTQTSQMSL